MSLIATKYGHLSSTTAGTMVSVSRRDRSQFGGPLYLGPAIEITPAELSSYECKGYAWQPKLDGCWCEIRCRRGFNELWSRNGKQSFTEGTEELTHLPTGLKDTYLVGEIEYATEASTSVYRKLGYRRIWLYDIHRFNGKDLYHLTYGERWQLLQKTYKQLSQPLKKVLLLVDCGKSGFRKAYDTYSTQELMEGIVLKKWDAQGFDTRNSLGKSMAIVRCKSTFTRDYAVIGWALTPKGAVTAVLGLWTGTGFKQVFQTPLPNMVVVKNHLNHEGKVVECFGWGLGKSGSLRHGHYRRFRPDKKVKDCTLESR